MPFGARARPHPCPETTRRSRPLIALLLLIGGLLLCSIACSAGVDAGLDGHTRTAGPPPLSAERYGPVAAATAPHGAHPGPHCASGTDAAAPQSRSAGQAAAPADLGVAATAAAVRPAVRGASPQRRPAPDGRSTLTALCRCRR
ncbi:hypothetical protein FCH28_24895 [Streptomyces piniterrae]|uniref:Uncharacterized protein n=1 Tax=Streptomyces piniterrae TaxID=2571125 RepID=A0A4U0N6W6_9ACTN|nr:hypothetical protein [Streptomyces piniterrae]TJZ49539.1 hypothetical protein FCH28_24895 [Streptomyces piniterrae]